MTRPPRPAALPVQFDNIPAELREVPRWVVWRYEFRKAKWAKPPFTTAGAAASSTDPATWATFDAARAAYARGGWDGVGLIHLPDDYLTGVDWDHCRDPATGAIADGPAGEVGRLDSYAEVSPSGTGVRGYARGVKPGDSCKRGDFEMYDGRTADGKPGGRYLTVTGHRLPDAPAVVHDRQQVIDQFYRQHFATPQRPPANGRSAAAPTPADADLVRRMTVAANGTKFRKLWAGDATDHDGDESRADLALCCMLAFWTGRDAAAIDRLFRQSGLMRAKWDEKRGATTYGQRTVARAIEQTRETYRGNGHVRPEPPTSAERPPAEPAAPTPAGPEWPEPMAAEAFHGPAGELVRLIEPATEADPAGLLLQVLIAFGSLAGRYRYCVAEADRHYPNEFAVLVGRTARGRKGSSWGRVREVMRGVEPAWADDRIQSGLSSGEGLIWAVRDPVVTREKFKGKGEVTFKEVESDPGVADKRLLVLEPEFANVLKQTERQGNTLSVVVRDAWDRGKLSTLTKNSPAKATDAHVSVVGHITDEELRRYLTTTECANGFANRFLFACVRRSKSLPDGGAVDAGSLAGVAAKVKAAAAFARADTPVARDAAARDVWHGVYPALTEDRPGMIGNLLARAESHVLRLSLIYALLDCSAVVRVEHLAAAVAVWDYCDQSARYVFGDSLGNPLADELLRLTRGCPDGITRLDITNYLGRHQPSDRIDQALGLLLRHGLAHPRQVETGGRPAERWHAGGRPGT